SPKSAGNLTSRCFPVVLITANSKRI
ncbi:unnamed protein product, partial [Allacma fusca]